MVDHGHGACAGREVGLGGAPVALPTVRLRTREQVHAATCTSTCSNAAKPAACSELWRSASSSAHAAVSAIPEEEAATRTSRQRQSARFEVCARPLRATTSRDHLRAHGHSLTPQPQIPTSVRAPCALSYYYYIGTKFTNGRVLINVKANEGASHLVSSN